MFDEEGIPRMNQEEDYDYYTTPDISRVDKTSFTVFDATEATSTLP